MLFIVLVATNKIGEYLHPRLIPFIIIAAVALLLMVYALFQDFRRRRRRVPLWPYIIFLFPLILAVTIPVADANGTFCQFANTSISDLTLGNSSDADVDTGQIQDSPYDNSATTSEDEAVTPRYDELHLQPNQTAFYTKTVFGATVVLIITDNKITLDDSNFVSWISELDNNPDKYKGMTVVYTGYVYKSTDFDSNYFVAARDMMWCCAADVQLIGCLCRYENAPELKDNSWVKVSGILDTSTWQGSLTPLIVHATITPVQKSEMTRYMRYTKVDIFM